LFKAAQTSLTQQAYHVQVTKYVSGSPGVEIDPEWEAARVAAWDEAERIRAEAREQAARLIADSEGQASNFLATERERIQSLLEAEVEAAKRSGYEQGALEARMMVEQEWNDRFAQVESLYAAAVEDRRRYLAESEPLIVDLACAIARKIMHKEATSDSEWVVNVVQAALEEIHDVGKIEVRVNPDDYEQVQARREGLRKDMPGQTDILIIPDRGVMAGGCVVQSAFGNIDARIDTQLEEVRKALRQVAAGLTS
jgi:flagellar assembly protein FliH